MKTSHIKHLFVSAFLGAVLITTSARSQTQGNASSADVKITIALFSGRPNPVVKISGGESQAILALLERLPSDASLKAENLSPNKSGYTGFYVRLPGDKASDYKMLRVFRDAVELRTFNGDGKGGSTAVLKRDVSRGIETALLNLVLAKDGLHDFTKALIKSEVAGQK